MEATQTQQIHEQVKAAMDGRTNRWLALEAKIHETELSKKLNNKVPFTESEIKRIENCLKVKFVRT